MFTETLDEGKVLNNKCDTYEYKEKKLPWLRRPHMEVGGRRIRGT